jgi:hypothetical protein
VITSARRILLWRHASLRTGRLAVRAATEPVLGSLAVTCPNLCSQRSPVKYSAQTESQGRRDRG